MPYKDPEKVRERLEEPELVPFKCKKCGELIIYVIPTAQVWCRHCQRWVKANESAPVREVVKNAL